MTGQRNRTLRRERTYTDIQQAALALFEAQGVKATTAEEIAQAAGVSPRTFFRYVSIKERAVLPAQYRVRAAIEAVAFDGGVTESDALRQVIEMLATVMDQEPSNMREIYRRVTRLLEREPELAGIASAGEYELFALLEDRLRAVIGAQPAGRVADVAFVIWRRGLQAWGMQTALSPSECLWDAYRLVGELFSR